MAREATDVIVGIDTHADTHHVAIVTEYGKPLADREFLAVGSGYRKILDFMTSHGTVTAVGSKEPVHTVPNLLGPSVAKG